MAGDRNADVIRAAIRIFGRQSYSATSVQDVADALNMPKGTLYHYIRSKEDLLAKIFEWSSSDMDVIIAEVNALEVTPLGRIEAFVTRYVEWSIDNLERAMIYSREWRYLTGPLRHRVVNRRVVLDDFLISLIEAAKSAGAVRESVDTKRTAYFIWGALSAVPDWYRRHGPDSPEQIASSYATLALNVITGDASTA